MERTASISLRSCLRGGRAIRCRVAGERGIDAKSSCLATSICPARTGAGAGAGRKGMGITTSTRERAGKKDSYANSWKGVKTERLGRGILHGRGYSTQESAAQENTQEQETSATQSTPAAAPQPLPSMPEHLNEQEQKIWEILMKEFRPEILEVQDISGGCGSMYGIEVVSESFKGLGMLKQQRMVNKALGEMVAGWHGVQLRTRAP